MSFASLTRTIPLALGLVTALVADDARAADWNIQVQKRSATSARVTFDAEPGQQFYVCWKLDSAPGDVCGYSGHATTVNVYSSGSGLSNPDYANGRMAVTLHSLATCNVDYKVRIRRTFVAFDTKVFRFPC